jgi:hypothetical protein
MAAADGAIFTKASIPRWVGVISADSIKLVSAARIVPVMVDASDPSVSSVAAVVIAAKTTTQSRIRPTGYHSSEADASDGAVPAASGRPSRARCPSHQAGSAMARTKAMQ